MQDKPKLPYFPLTNAAWRSVCADLDPADRCILWELVARYGELGFLPNDDKALANITHLTLRRWLKVKPRLAPKFPLEGWRWPEIDQKIMHREKISVERSLLGTRGNVRRWATLKVKH